MTALLNAWNNSPTFVSMALAAQAQNIQIIVGPINSTATQTNPPTSSGPATIQIAPSELTNIIVGGTVNTAYIDALGVRVGHELGHATQPGGIGDAAAATTPLGAATIELSGEGVAIYNQYLVSLQLGVPVAPGDTASPTLQSQLNTAYANDTVSGVLNSAKFQTDAIAIGESWMANQHPSSAPGLTYVTYNEDYFAAREIGIDPTTIDWQHAAAGAVTISDANGSAWSISGQYTALDGTVLNVSGSLSADDVVTTGTNSSTGANFEIDTYSTPTGNAVFVTGTGAVVGAFNSSIYVAAGANVTVSGQGDTIYSESGSTVTTYTGYKNTNSGSGTFQQIAPPANATSSDVDAEGDPIGAGLYSAFGGTLHVDPYSGMSYILYADGSRLYISNSPSQPPAAFDEINYTELAGVLGSSLGRYLGGSSVVLNVAEGSLLGALAMTTGQQIEAAVTNGYYQTFDGSTELLSNGESVWSNFGTNVGSEFASQSVGSLSSILSIELAQALGLNGFGAGLFSAGATGVLQQVLTNLAANSGPALANLIPASELAAAQGNILAGIPDAFEASIVSFFATQLGSLIVKPTTEAGSILGSVGALIGGLDLGDGFVGGAVVDSIEAGLDSIGLGALEDAVGSVLDVVPGIGILLGYVIGTLIGDLFGAHKPRVPTASAQAVLQIPLAEYTVGGAIQANGGSLNLVTSMATTAANTLNGIIALITHNSPTPYYVSNGGSPTQTYGQTGSQLWVNLGAGQMDVSTAAQAVDIGVTYAAITTDIIGGDIILKRALRNTQADSTSALLGDLQTATDYEEYLTDKPVIDAAIAAPWNSLSAADQAFYTANSAFMTRALSMSQVSLDSADQAFYNANQTQITRIIGELNVSQFAASWMVTLERAGELNLGQWSPSDFYGGLAGFLQSFNINGANAGSGPHYQDVTLSMSGGALTISLPTADTGVFSLLPQASTSGNAITIASFGTNVGYVVSTVSSGTNGYNTFISAAGSTTGVTIAGTITTTKKGGLIVTNPDTSNDIFIGGLGNDTLTAGSGYDWLQSGGNGNDTITGGAGTDVLLGGGGNDTIKAGSGTTYIDGGAGTNTITLGAGNDTVAGSLGVDNITGSTGNLTYIAYDDAGAYTSTLTGGTGSNTLSFAQFNEAVTVNLATGAAPAGMSTTGFQNIIGSNYNDTLTGGSKNAVITAGAGADILTGGLANNTFVLGSGTATIYGEGLSNTLSYADSTAAVYVDLANDVAYGGYATGDVFTNIQNIIGSSYDDTLEGNSGVNTITTGNGSSDIIATEGADSYIGGLGFDTVDYSQSGFMSSGTTAGITVTIGANNGGTVVYHNSDGTSGTQTLSKISQIIGTGTSSSDVYTSNSSSNMTWDTDGATATFHNAAGTGSDTYLFGLGYNTITINDSSSGSNTLEMKAGVTFDMMWGYNNNGVLEVGIRGQTGQINVNSDFVYQNPVIKTIEVSGGDTVDMSQNDGGNILTAPNTTFNVSYTTDSMVWAYYGGDVIDTTYGGVTQYGSIISPDVGGDTITSGAADDQFLFERGNGSDVIYDDGGHNTVVFGPTVAATDVIYNVVGANLYIGLVNLSNPSQTADQVPDHLEIVNGGVKYVNASTGAVSWNTMFWTEAGGTTVNLSTLTNINWDVQTTGTGSTVAPIVLGLNGAPLELTQVATSNIVTKDANGILNRMGWVGPNDGILVDDKAGNGQVNNVSDISFINDVPGATNDLQGLAAFDTNGDGAISAADSDFNQLKVWVDANQDGQVEAGELFTLAQLGITSISLAGTPSGFDGSDTSDSYSDETTTFTYANGTTGTAYDVALAREFLPQTGAGNAPDVSWSQVTSNATIGELLNNPVTAAKAAQAAARSQTQSLAQLATLAGGLTEALSDQYAQTSFNGSSAPISASEAAMWATANAPTTPTTYSASQLAAIEASAPGLNTLTGRGSGIVTRLQSLVVDYTGQGASLIAPGQAPILADANNTGVNDEIGWVGASEGFLVANVPSSGVVSITSNVSFTADKPGAVTDIQALSAFDTNGDGVINASDAGYSELGIWRDFNQNGATDPGEYRTLAQAGVAQISLDPTNQQLDNGTTDANQVQGELQLTLTNGTVLNVYDTALGEIQPTNDVNTPAAAPEPSNIAASTLASTSSTSNASTGATTLAAPGTSTTASTNATAGGVTASLLGEDGPEGETVSATSSSTTAANPTWWVNTSTGPSVITLQGSLQSFNAAMQQAGTPLAGEVVAAGGTDAAALQRQQLLRQSLAAFQGAGGGSSALAGSQGTQAVAATLVATTGSNTQLPVTTPTASALAA